MKKLFVFDLDGTLVNSIDDIAAAVNYSLEKMNKPTYKNEKYYKMVGNGMEALCRRAIPNGTEEEVQKLINLYSNRYINNCCNLTKPYTEIPKLLEMLKTGGARAAVLSNKPQAQSDEVVSKLFEKDMFYMVIGHGSGFAPKPSPDSFNYLVNCAGVKKSDVCYVGDSNVDIMLGKNAGVDTIGAEWGFRGRKELEDAGAVYIAKHPLEILDIIKEIQ